MWIEIIVLIIGISVAAKLLPSFILLSRFAYPNAKFSAIPNNYIKEKEIARLLESKNLEGLKNNVVSKDFILEGRNAGEIQKSIDESLARIIKMAKNDSPPNVKMFYDAYLKKLDEENIKKAVRQIYEGKEMGDYIMLSNGGMRLIEKLKKVDREEAEHVLKDHGFNINFEMSMEEIEREIDKAILEELKKVPLPKSCRGVRDKFVGILIDVMNIKAILRGKHYGRKDIEKSIIEGGWEISEWKINELMKIDSVAEIISMLEGTSYMPYLRQAITDYEKKGIVAIEKALDMYIIDAAGDIANENPMGIGPGIRFLVEKEYEARNLKAVAKAIEEGMQEEAWDVMVVT